jgi:glycosyltransferase involved in cell wall biosynthesis
MYTSNIKGYRSIYLDFPMKKLTVGLISIGGNDWIAGLNFIKSLLVANSLLPENIRLSFRLYLRHKNDKRTNYQDVEHLIESVKWISNFPGSSYTLFRNFINPLRHIILERSLVYRSKENIFSLKKENQCQIFFPANHHPNIYPESSKKISWIPDFQFKNYPEMYSYPMIKKLDRQYKNFLSLSDLTLLNNHLSRSHVKVYFSKWIDNVKVLPFTMWLGPNPTKQNWESRVEKYLLPEKYLIFPSQLWKHKNHMMLFKAINQMKRNGLKDIALVCTGYLQDNRYPKHYKKLQAYINENNLHNSIRILGLLPRTDQVQLMRGSVAIVQPSLFEGWSALLDEAHSLGKKIYVSDIPMHHEQHFENTVYFSPNNYRELADKIAMDWQGLVPGPNLHMENQAIKQYWKRLSKFGENFSDICHLLIRGGI